MSAEDPSDGARPGTSGRRRALEVGPPPATPRRAQDVRVHSPGGRRRRVPLPNAGLRGRLRWRMRRVGARVGPLARRALTGSIAAMAVAMLLCALVGALRDGRAVGAMLESAAILAAVATVLALSLRGHALGSPTSRDGLLAAGLTWVVCGLLGSVPFLLAGSIDDPFRAVFESVSGLTTTGATVIDDIDAQPDAILLWRSLSHWLGGVGIVVLLVAIVPTAGGAARRVFLGEASRAVEDQIAPRMRDTARITAGIYVALTVLGVGLLVAVGLSPWEATNHAMSAISTGGFSTRTASVSAFASPGVELALIALMFAGGVSFVLWWRLWTRRGVRPHLPELRAYAAVVLGGGLLMGLILVDDGGAWMRSLRDGVFTSVSIITTTGFTTDDYDQWDERARFLVLLAICSGACVGSTSGGVKIRRWLVLLSGARAEVARQLNPRRIVVARVGGEPVPDDTVRAAFGFMAIAALLTVACTALLTALGIDLVSAFTGSLACLFNVGPALGEFGAVEPYKAVPEPGVVALTMLMLLGRLELFTILALFSRQFWRAH